MKERLKVSKILKNYITNSYKELFGPQESLSTIDRPRFGDIAKVITEEDNFLTSPFTEKEVQDATLPWNIIRHLAQMVS